MLSAQQIEKFVRDGYLTLPQLASSKLLKVLRLLTSEHLTQREQPFELEADIHYPGAPDSEDAQGGDTIRRLLNAYQRQQEYQAVAENPLITSAVQQLLQSVKVYLTPNHHNCVMTKQPEFSSQTNWHRDTRYWHFNNKYLVNAWLALNDERAENGGMLILPGSHRWDVNPEALDEVQFLREDYPSNRARLSLAQQVDLNAGDCLLFSAHCFHAAGSNTTNRHKQSLVFTFHGESTHGLPATKSSQLPSIRVL